MPGAAKNTIPAISALLNNKTADGRIENITVNKKQKEKTVMKKDYVHLCVVLDASGSMARIKDGIKSSINTFMAEQKKEQGKTVFDVFQFSNKVNRIVEHADMADYKDDLMDSYSCSGMTALYDAVCIAIDTLGKEFAAMPEEERPEHVLFAIVTDGFENASDEFSLSDVKERIDRQTEKYSWEFVYLAANQDEFEAKRTSRSMGIGFCKSTMKASDLSCMTECVLSEVTAKTRKRRISDSGK